MQANTWFGVQDGRTVTVVWCYLSYVTAWAALFKDNSAVARLIAAAVSQDNFPHYNTLDTSLSATQINLLANLTGWYVVSADADSGHGVFSNLFTATGARIAQASRQG